MNITPAPVQKPARPVVPPGAQTLDVAYTGPVTRDEVIGSVPDDGYSALFTGTFSESNVVRPQPVVGGDGQPTFEPKVAQLDLRPYSPWKRGLVGGAIGAGVLGAAGTVAGYLAGNMALGAVLGTLGGAAAGAGIGAAKVMGDEVSPDWELRQVYRHEMHGYSHSAIPQTQTIQTGKDTSVTITTGYWHTYSPNIQQIPVGDKCYWYPVARHSSDA